MTNPYYKLCNKITFNTYDKLTKSSFLTLLGSGAYVISNIVYQNMAMLEVGSKINFSSFLIFLLLTLSNGHYFTKDVTKVKEYYQEFIKNYNQLNEMFHFQNPLEIYKLYSLLVKNGYLSKDKIFTSTSENVADLIPLMGANIFAGHGVCRHKACLLTDILKDYGIDAFNYNCLYRNFILEKVELEKEEKSKEELLSWIDTLPNEYWQKKCYNLIEMYKKEGKFLELKFYLETVSSQKQKKGNHVITYAISDEYGYYLDPTMEQTYRYDASSNSLNNGFATIQPKPKYFRIWNKKAECLKLKQELLKEYPCIPIEEENKIIASTEEIFEKNQDIFEKFYRENKSLYEETSEVLSRIKTKNALMS